MESSLERLMDGTEVNRLEEALRFAGFSMPTALQLCGATGIEVAEIPGLLEQLKSEGRWQPIGDTNISVVSGTIDDLTDRLVAWLERHHKSHPDLPGRLADSVLGWLERMTTRSLARPLLLLLVENGTIRRLGRFVCLPAFAPSLSGADEKLMLAMIDAIRAGGFQPPAPEDVPSLADVDRKRQTRLVTLAVALGELVQIDGKIFLADDVERQLRERVADLVTREGKVTVAQIREALASSRKYAVPFLEYLDRIGYTKRVGDYRILTESENE
jgi:selenocysteine-specific elongation factor